MNSDSNAWGRRSPRAMVMAGIWAGILALGSLTGCSGTPDKGQSAGAAPTPPATGAASGGTTAGLKNAGGDKGPEMMAGPGASGATAGSRDPEILQVALLPDEKPEVVKEKNAK